MNARIGALIALGAALVAQDAVADCKDVPAKLFGVALGPIAGYKAHFKGEFEVDEPTELFKGVGWEELHAAIDGVGYSRIQLMTDRGTFYGFSAMAKVPTLPDHGLSTILSKLDAASGVSRTDQGQMIAYRCGDGASLTAMKMAWDDADDANVYITLDDPAADAKVRQYKAQFCADKKNRKPRDDCDDGINR